MGGVHFVVGQGAVFLYSKQPAACRFLHFLPLFGSVKLALASIALPGLKLTHQCSISPPPCCRSPAHCIEYAKIILWPRERPDDTFDAGEAGHRGVSVSMGLFGCEG